jgi:hypothetical protein
VSLNQKAEKDVFGNFIDQTTSLIAFPRQTMKKIPKFSFDKKKYKTIDENKRSQSASYGITSKDDFDEVIPLPVRTIKPHRSILSRSNPSITFDSSQLPLKKNNLTSKDNLHGFEPKDQTSKPRKSLKASEFIIKKKMADERSSSRTYTNKYSMLSRSFVHK